MKTTTPTRVLLYSVSALLIGYAAYGVSTDHNTATIQHLLHIDAETGRAVLVSKKDLESGRSCSGNKKMAGASTLPLAAAFDDEDCDCLCDENEHPGSCIWDIKRDCKFVPEGTCQGDCTWHMEDKPGETCLVPSVDYKCEEDSEGECTCADIYESPAVNTLPPGCQLVLPKGQFPSGDDVNCHITAEDDCDFCVREKPVTQERIGFRCDYNP